MALHTFSVTVDTDKHDCMWEPDAETLIANIQSNLEYDYGVLVRVAPITGTCRQQLIGEVEND